jgi:hypothetical protein
LLKSYKNTYICKGQICGASIFEKKVDKKKMLRRMNNKDEEGNEKHK